MRNVQQKEEQMMELVPLALECAAFVSLLSLYSMSAEYINPISIGRCQKLGIILENKVI